MSDEFDACIWDDENELPQQDVPTPQEIIEDEEQPPLDKEELPKFDIPEEDLPF